jgi:hypothetical protein
MIDLNRSSFGGSNLLYNTKYFEVRVTQCGTLTSFHSLSVAALIAQTLNNAVTMHYIILALYSTVPVLVLQNSQKGRHHFERWYNLLEGILFTNSLQIFDFV